jgi:hypothetical protein
MNYDPNLEAMPYYYVCILEDLRDKINMELDTCKSDEYKSQFRMIKKGLQILVDDFDDIFHGDITKENLK